MTDSKLKARLVELQVENERLQDELRRREADCYHSDANLDICSDLVTEARQIARDYRRKSLEQKQRSQELGVLADEVNKLVLVHPNRAYWWGKDRARFIRALRYRLVRSERDE